MHHTTFSRYVMSFLMMAAFCLAGPAQPARAQVQAKSEAFGKAPKAASVPTSATEELVPLDIERPSPRYRRETNYWDLKPVSPFMVPRGITLLSGNKLVTASVEPCVGELQQITDGEKTNRYASNVVRLGLGVQWVQIDLGEACDIYAIAVWHNFREDPYVFRDVVIRCADDPDFKKNVRTFFNNDRDNSAQLGQGMDLEYVDTWQGKIIDGKDARGKPTRTRYIRCYSNGKNNADGLNDYTEIEVFGRSAGAQVQSENTPSPTALKATGTQTSATEELVPLEIKKPRQKFRPGISFVTVDELYANPRPPLIVPREVRLLSLNKKVTASAVPLMGDLTLVTDGDKEDADGFLLELDELGVQWVQVDLEKSCEVFAVVIWHRFFDRSVYHDVIVQCADDPDFKTNVKTLFNNDSDNSAKLGQGTDGEYVDTWQGKRIDGRDKQGKPVRARYIRCYSNGSTFNGANNYLEVEVYGRPIGAQPKLAEKTLLETKPKATLAQTSPSADLVPLELNVPRRAFGDFGDGGTRRFYYDFGEGRENLDDEKFYQPRPPFMAPKGVRLLSLHKKVTSSVNQLIVIGELKQVTDGDKNMDDGHYVELDPGVQWVQVDLDEPCDIYAMVIWHAFTRPHVYHDVVVQCAEDSEFKSGVKTLFNNDTDNSAKLGKGFDREYVETWQGKLIDGKDKQGKPARARYIRCTSNGNCWNGMNHYVEVELYGRPCIKADQ